MLNRCLDDGSLMNLWSVVGAPIEEIFRSLVVVVEELGSSCEVVAEEEHLMVVGVEMPMAD